MTEELPFGYDDDDMSMEDLIPDEDTVIAMTHLRFHQAYGRRQLSRVRTVEVKALKECRPLREDYIEDLLMTTNHHYMMFFTNTGRVYRIKAMRSRKQDVLPGGTAIEICCRCSREKKITAIIPMRELNEDKYLFMAKEGYGKEDSDVGIRKCA